MSIFHAGETRVSHPSCLIFSPPPAPPLPCTKHCVFTLIRSLDDISGLSIQILIFILSFKPDFLHPQTSPFHHSQPYCHPLCLCFVSAVYCFYGIASTSFTYCDMNKKSYFLTLESNQVQGQRRSPNED